jgi:hypothetical protein
VVVDVEQHQRARGLGRAQQLAEAGHAFAAAEHHAGNHHQVRVARRDLAPRHQAQVDAALVAVDAQDEVDGVELLVRGHHAQLLAALQRIEHRAQALAGAGLGDDAVGALGAHEPRGEGAPALPGREPFAPGLVHVVVPDLERVLHVLRHAVGRPAERMIGEVDLAAPAHAREARPDAVFQPGFSNFF